MTFDLFAQEFFQKTNLLLLHFDEFRPFSLAKLVQFILNHANFEFGFKIDFVIVFGIFTVFAACRFCDIIIIGA